MFIQILTRLVISVALILTGCTRPKTSSGKQWEPDIGPQTVESIGTVVPDSGDSSQILERPNILIVLADDLGTDKLEMYGNSPAPPLPTLDSLAASGVRMGFAYASPTCMPSRAGLQTGLWGPDTQILGIVGCQVVSADDDYGLSEAMVTIAEAMVDEGYRTGHIGKWHLNTRWDPEDSSLPGDLHQWPGKNGYEVVLGNSALGMSNNQSCDTPEAENSRFSGYKACDGDGTCAIETEWDDTYLVNRALEFFAECEVGVPCFLHLALTSPHYAYATPPTALVPNPLELGETNNQFQFHAMLQALDVELGRLLEGIPPNTVVIFLGDNGTAAGLQLPPMRPDWDVKSTIHEGGVRVPLIVSGSGIAQGVVRLEPVVVQDLFATILEMVGGDMVGLPAEDTSRSFWPIIAADGGGEYIPRTTIPSFIGTNGPDWINDPWQYSIRNDQYRLEAVSDGGVATVAYSLYSVYPWREEDSNADGWIDFGEVDSTADLILDGVSDEEKEAVAELFESLPESAKAELPVPVDNSTE